MGAPTAEQVLARDQASLDPDVWETLARVKGESKAAYQAFLDYVRMGARRSLRQLALKYVEQAASSPLAPPTTKVSTLFTWSADNKWQERLTAYTAEWQTHEQAIWEERRRAIRQADWEAGEALRTLAAHILEQSPQFLKTTRRLVKGTAGVPDREVVTLAIQVDDMLKALKLGSELQRAAAEIPQKIEVEIADMMPKLLETMKTLGISPAAVFAALLAQMEAEKDKLGD